MKKIPLNQKQVCATPAVRNLIYTVSALLASSLLPAHADTGVNDTTKTAQFTVSAQVLQGCLLGAGSTDVSSFGSLNFGNNITDLSSAINISSSSSAGSVVFKCTSGTVMSIALDAGLNAGINMLTGRRMKNTTTTETLTYQLYQDVSNTIIWGNNVNGGLSRQVISDGTVQELKIYGSLLAASQRPSAGQYTDTVTVTVTY